MQRAVQVPSALIDAILGLVVIFVVSADIYARKRAQRRGNQWPELFTLPVLLGILYSGIRLATPLICMLQSVKHFPSVLAS